MTRSGGTEKMTDFEKLILWPEARQSSSRICFILEQFWENCWTKEGKTFQIHSSLVESGPVGG